MSEDLTEGWRTQTFAPYVSIFEALDNTESRMHFMKMLGFEPIYDDKGNIVAWEDLGDTPDYKQIISAFLALISSKKSMAIANLEEAEPLSEVEVELTAELVLELIDLLAPPDFDKSPYIPAIEVAKLEMKKALTLANKGLLVRSLIGAPILPESGATPIETKPVEEKRGLLGKLLGGG